MKHLKSYIHTIFLLIAISCNSIKTEEHPVEIIDFSVTASTADFEEAEAETKATSQYVVKYTWEAGDQISVVNLRTRKILGGSLIAASSSNTTDFNGTLNGSIASEDPLLFVYPALDNASETGFNEITLDFSHQGGSSSNNVFLVSYAVGQATSNGTTSTSTDLSFNYLVCYNYTTLSNLPKAEAVEKVTISGVPNMLGLSWDYAKNTIVTRSIFTKNGVETDNYDESSIELQSSNFKTGNNGDRPVYFTCPDISTTIATEKVVRVSFSNAMYEGTLPSTGKYSAGYNYRRVLSNFRRIDETSLSFSAPFTYNFYGDEDTYDFPENLDLYENGHQGWKRGDELSVVNLTTGELLQGTLWSEANGGITDFSGTVYGDKGLNEGDKLLLLYPAVGNESAMDFKTTPIIYDVSAEQDGTLGNVPLIMAARATYAGGRVSFSQEYPFEHLTSIIQLSATLDPYYIEVEGGDIEVDGDDEEETENGDNEGFYEEGGAWSEEDYFGETSLDFTPTGMEILHVPTKLMISYAGDEDYKLATINDGTDLISVSNDCGVTVEDSKASPFYISIPAAIGDAWGSYTSIAASYYSPDGIKYLTYDYQWNLRMQTFYEIDIPLPYDMADDMDEAEEGDENTNI